MAVTITRSVWIDDDGTGTTGTVINQALHTTLYNEIDTALAKLAQLAGGNTLTGQQIVNAVLTVNHSNQFLAQVSVAAAGPGTTGFAVRNTDPGNSMSLVAFYNSANAVAGSISQTGATTVVYATTSDARLKDDAGRATDVAALRAVVVHEFTWRADGVRDRGVFAQEAHALYPRAIAPGTDATTTDGSLAHPWMTDYSKFVPDLIVGWQQHDAELAELRALLATVKG
jgi:hypothetical protein